MWGIQYTFMMDGFRLRISVYDGPTVKIATGFSARFSASVAVPARAVCCNGGSSVSHMMSATKGKLC